MAPGDLQEVLSVLRRPVLSEETARNLMVGLDAADDAAVYRISDDLALVETVDFFPPVVDDAWTWGAVAGFPREMDKAIVAEVFRGGAEKVAEAGGVIAGGHTVVDNEPKYGLCVTGRVHPDRVLIKGGLRPGDRLFLSKALGTGVITTAAKDGAAPDAALAAAIASMLRLNRVAARVARDAGATGATDITGFGFLGHAGEMVSASDAGIAVDTARLPFLPHARALADAGHFSGGMKRNRRYLEGLFGARLEIGADVPAVIVSLLMEAETSGGLLFSVRPDRAGGVREAFRAAGEEVVEIGEVLTAPVLRLR